MKKIFLFISLMITFSAFTGCDKQKASVRMTVESLSGSWELRKTQVSMIPLTIHAAGNGDVYKFNGSSYEKYVNGSLQKSGSFKIVEDNSVQQTVGLKVPEGEFTRRIIFDNEVNNGKIFIHLSGNELRLISGYFPLDSGAWLVYEKI